MEIRSKGDRSLALSPSLPAKPHMAVQSLGDTVSSNSSSLQWLDHSCMGTDAGVLICLQALEPNDRLRLVYHSALIPMASACSHTFPFSICLVVCTHLPWCHGPTCPYAIDSRNSLYGSYCFLPQIIETANVEVTSRLTPL